MQFFSVICSEGHPQSVPITWMKDHPSETVKCKHMYTNQEGTRVVCDKSYPVTDILKAMESHKAEFYAKDETQGELFE